MFKNSFLTKHLWVTVSVISKKEDPDYCRLSSWGTERGSRFSVAEHEEFKWVETKPDSLSKKIDILGEIQILNFWATRVSHKAPTYMSWKEDPQRIGRDDYQTSWGHSWNYSLPLSSLIIPVLSKAMITPMWQTQSWYLRLLQLSEKNPLLPKTHYLTHDVPIPDKKKKIT